MSNVAHPLDTLDYNFWLEHKAAKVHVHVPSSVCHPTMVHRNANLAIGMYIESSGVDAGGGDNDRPEWAKALTECERLFPLGRYV